MADEGEFDGGDPDVPIPRPRPPKPGRLPDPLPFASDTYPMMPEGTIPAAPPPATPPGRATLDEAVDALRKLVEIGSLHTSLQQAILSASIGGRPVSLPALPGVPAPPALRLPGVPADADVGGRPPPRGRSEDTPPPDPDRSPPGRSPGVPGSHPDLGAVIAALLVGGRSGTPPGLGGDDAVRELRTLRASMGGSHPPSDLAAAIAAAIAHPVRAGVGVGSKIAGWAKAGARLGRALMRPPRLAKAGRALAAPFRGVLGKAGRGAGVGAAAGAVVGVVGVLNEFRKAIADASDAALASAKKYTDVSGSMAAVFAQKEVADLMRDIKIGEETAGSTGALATSDAARKDAEADIGILLTNLQNGLLTALNTLITPPLEVIAAVASKINSVWDQIVKLLPGGDPEAAGIAAGITDVFAANAKALADAKDVLNLMKTMDAKVGGGVVKPKP